MYTVTMVAETGVAPDFGADEWGIVRRIPRVVWLQGIAGVLRSVRRWCEVPGKSFSNEHAKQRPQETPHRTLPECGW